MMQQRSSNSLFKLCEDALIVSPFSSHPVKNLEHSMIKRASRDHKPLVLPPPTTNFMPTAAQLEQLVISHH